MGRRNFFVFCITVFTVASFLCGAAPSLPLLLLFRVIQGAGGGGMQPMAQAIMADSFEPHKRGQAFALYGLVAVLAPSIGPTLGGWITDNFSWRWIFFINIPVGILAFFLVTRLVDDPPWIKADPSKLRNMDYVGLAFLTIAMGGMQIMLDKGEENDWFASSFIRFFAVLFVGGMIGLFVWEWRQKNPLINLKLFRFQELRDLLLPDDAGRRCAECEYRAAAAVYQQLLGYNATTAGLALTAGGVALVIMMPLAGICHGQDFGAHAGGMRVHHVRLYLPLCGERDHAADELCAGVLAARSADAAAAVLFYLDHQRGVCGHAQGSRATRLPA